jgi:transposase
MTDGQWALLAPLLPAAGSTGGRGGRPEKWDRRLVLDAIFYLVRGGIAWRALPADFPPHQTVHALLRRWTRARAWCRIYAALRERARLADGRGPVPTAAVIDSQTVCAADTVPTASSGYDGGKKIKGRKRHVAVDTGGLLLAVVVTTASLQDRDGAFRITAALREASPRSPWCGPTPGTQAGSSATRARSGTWPWRSSSAPTRPRALSCCTAAGSWNAPSPG